MCIKETASSTEIYKESNSKLEKYELEHLFPNLVVEKLDKYRDMRVPYELLIYEQRGRYMSDEDIENVDISVNAFKEDKRVIRNYIVSILETLVPEAIDTTTK